MEALSLALLLWIGEHSPYNTDDMSVPEVIEMSPQSLTKEAYSEHPDKAPASGVDERIYALYAFEDGPQGTIYILSADLTEGAEHYTNPIDNPLFQERLLHELVHHAQRISGKYDQIPCRNFAEKDAYLLGGQFLKENGVADPMPNRQFWAHLYSRC